MCLGPNRKIDSTTADELVAGIDLDQADLVMAAAIGLGGEKADYRIAAWIGLIQRNAM
jgi:hypothetical protein